MSSVTSSDEKKSHFFQNFVRRVVGCMKNDETATHTLVLDYKELGYGSCVERDTKRSV